MDNYLPISNIININDIPREFSFDEQLLLSVLDFFGTFKIDTLSVTRMPRR